MTRPSKRKLKPQHRLLNKQLVISYHILLFTLLLACHRKETSSDNLYFTDFLISESRGIKPISGKELLKSKVYIKVLNSNKEIDKIQVCENGNTTAIADIDIYSNESRKVLDLSISSSTYGMIKEYLQVNKNNAVSYFFITPVKSPDETTEIYIMRYYADSAIEYSAGIKLADTSNLVRKLLSNENIPVFDSTAPKRRDLKFDDSFTIKRFLALE